MGGISSRVRVIPPARSQRDWKPVRLPSYRTVSDLAVWRGGDTLSAIGAMSIPSHDFHNTRSPHVKRAVSISLGSSTRNKAVEVELLGEMVSIERVGTDGDEAK